MYFLDNDHLILACTCNFILDVEDNTKNMQEKKTTETSFLVESRGNSLLPSLVPSKSVSSLNQPKGYETRHKPVHCALVPHDDSNSVIFISSEYIIMNYNLHASAFFGISSENIGVKKIKEFIFNIEELFEKAKKHIDVSSGMLVEFSPVQTFLISANGTFNRIRILINSYCVDNNIFYILTISEPGAYSKPTQRFFSLFIQFLEVYLKQGGHLGGNKIKKIRDADSKDKDIEEDYENEDDDEEKEESSSHITKLLYRVRKEVERKNKKKSPELENLNKLMWIFMILMMAAFGGSYAVSVNAFENYLLKVTHINILTDIRVQSSLISTYIMMLNMAREGYPTPDTPDNLISELRVLALDTKDKINYISSRSSVSELNQDTIPCISFRFLSGYELIYFTPVNALLQQVNFVLELTKNNLTSFDIMNNSYCF